MYIIYIIYIVHVCVGIAANERSAGALLKHTASADDDELNNPLGVNEINFGDLVGRVSKRQELIKEAFSSNRSGEQSLNSKV